MTDAFVPDRVLHSFPQLSGMDQPDEPEEDACEIFKPLFCGVSASLAQSHMIEPEGNEPLNPDIIEEARERGFQGGYALGKAEACNSAKAALTPEFHDFTRCIRNISDYTRTVTAACASSIVNLTVEIAAHILGGEKLSVSAKELDELQTELQSALAGAYRLTFGLHPQDREALEQLVADGTCEWPVPLAVDIQTDSDVASGCLNVCKKEDQFGRLEHLAIKKIEDLLGQAPA